MNTRDISEGALHLPERERLGIATALLRSMESDEEALADVTARARAHELDSGVVVPLGPQEVFATARAALG